MLNLRKFLANCSVTVLYCQCQPGWRNWQTHGTQNPAPLKGVSVRPRLSAIDTTGTCCKAGALFYQRFYNFNCCKNSVLLPPEQNVKTVTPGSDTRDDAVRYNWKLGRINGRFRFQYLNTKQLINAFKACWHYILSVRHDNSW